jgi:hypothetical protein
MILETILIVGGLAAGIGVIAFWDDIKEWLNSLFIKVKKFANRVTLGAKIFIRKLKEGYEETAEVWQQDKNGQFYRTTETKKINESEVPPEILAKAKIVNEKVDISQDLEKELKLIL